MFLWELDGLIAGWVLPAVNNFRGCSDSYNSSTNEKHIGTASNHQNTGRGSKPARYRVHMAHMIKIYVNYWTFYPVTPPLVQVYQLR